MMPGSTLSVFGAVIDAWPTTVAASGVFGTMVDAWPTTVAASGVFGTMVDAWPIVLAVAALVVGATIVTARRAPKQRADLLARSLPGSIDRCAVILGAGGTIRECVEAMASSGPPEVAACAAEALARADRGDQLGGALRHLRASLGDTYQPLLGALLVAHEQGGPVGPLLTRLGAEAAASRRRIGERRARRLPVLVLLPLVVCSLPAVLIGTIVPVAIVALRDLTR